MLAAWRIFHVLSFASSMIAVDATSAPRSFIRYVSSSYMSESDLQNYAGFCLTGQSGLFMIQILFMEWSVNESERVNQLITPKTSIGMQKMERFLGYIFISYNNSLQSHGKTHATLQPHRHHSLWASTSYLLFCSPHGARMAVLVVRWPWVTRGHEN